MSNVIVYCNSCGFAMEPWEFQYSNIYCTICPGLPEFREVDDFEDYDREWDRLD